MRVKYLATPHRKLAPLSVNGASRSSYVRTLVMDNSEIRGKGTEFNMRGLRQTAFLGKAMKMNLPRSISRQN